MNIVKTILLACVIVSMPMSVRGVELIVTVLGDNAKLWDLNGTGLANS